MRFRLCYITDPITIGTADLTATIAEATTAGVDLIQIRARGYDTRALLRLSRHAVARAAGTSSHVVINDRLDLALGLGAAGVHLGNHSMPAAKIRQLAPEGFQVGVSCHSLQEALNAGKAGADYILVGPIFETPSKLAFGPPLGLDKLREIAASVTMPVLAVGGVTVGRVKPCLEAGASGVAAIRLFQDAPSLVKRVAELRAQFPV